MVGRSRARCRDHATSRVRRDGERAAFPRVAPEIEGYSAGLGARVRGSVAHRWIFQMSDVPFTLLFESEENLLMQWEWPLVTAEITFLRRDEGGRLTAPMSGTALRYMPHTVLQDRSVRKALIDADRVVRELYHGVAFVEGPPEFRLLLMYDPHDPYSDVLPGATFTVREGAKVVAHGIVKERVDPA
jgi:hypothetical protein